MSTITAPRTTIYLGSTADDRHVWAEVELRNYAAEQNREPDYMLTTTDHRQVRAGDVTTVSVMFIVARSKARTVDRLNSDGFDRFIESIGQIAPEERVIVKRNPALTADDLAVIEDAWTTDHLNTLIAGCDHNVAPTAEQIAAPDFPQSYGRPDVTGWRIKHDVCPVTGYRYGTAWLTRVIADDKLSTLRTVMARNAYPVN